MTRITLRQGIYHSVAIQWLDSNVKYADDFEWVPMYNQFIIKDDAIAIMFRLKFGV